MRIYLLFLCLFLIDAGWAKTRYMIIPDKSEVRRGEMFQARLTLQESNDGAMTANLTGMTLGDTLYIHRMSPFIKKAVTHEAELKLVFIQVPKTKSIVANTPQGPIEISFESLKISSAGEAKDFLLGDFVLPSSSKYLIWILLFLIASVFVFLVSGWIVKRKRLKVFKNQLKQFKQEILTAQTYEEIVAIWFRRSELKQYFPQLIDHYTKFEKVLNEYQFKPARSEFELTQILRSYDEFKSQVREDLHGI